ncbi:MAG: hypothetical protein M1829_002676 [Trizodia sp. TS-e1964]|nr:MAG: hypothetical protein M1829_002676 [Trizodia sp. TS-e1964]
MSTQKYGLRRLEPAVAEASKAVIGRGVGSDSGVVSIETEKNNGGVRIENGALIVRWVWSGDRISLHRP